MILDSSAIVAVLLREPGHEPLLDMIEPADPVGVGTPTLAETAIVVSAKLGPSGKTLLARFVEEAGLIVIPFADEHWRAAADAFLRYGKGRDPAALNFGDCMTYATAQLAGRPLLCLGNDFAKTDLTLAAPA